jgi:hypothetical protein
MTSQTADILRSSHWAVRSIKGCLFCALAVWLSVSATACRNDSENQKAEQESTVTRTAAEGPVTLSMSVSATDLSFQDSAEVHIEATADPGVEAHVEDYDSVLSEKGLAFELRVVRAEKSPPSAAPDGRVTHRHRYRLEFVLPGVYELPPARLTYIDKEAAQAIARNEAAESLPEFNTLVTEPITITARETQRIRTLEPVELPTVWSRWWWLGPVILVVAASAVLVLVRPLRRLIGRRLARLAQPRAVVIPAHEWALQQFAALAAERLLQRGLWQEFHYRISYIIRGYIERRFHVSAAEMTTEEFLEAAVADVRFGPRITEELSRFLSACDLVKYARHEPTVEESDAELAAARSFVERTGERAQPPAESSTAGVAARGQAA